MAEYIDKGKAFNAVDKRIDELKGDKQFNIVKEIDISGVKKHIASISPADVVEIPEGATNGDMIKAMFPDLANSNLELVDVLLITKSWWNSPYRLEGRK